jgi:hypothetical protein
VVRALLYGDAEEHAGIFMFRFVHRIGRHFGARLDGMIRKVENHEALVESAVRDVERSLERAVRDHERACDATKRLRAELVEERSAIVSWRERALREPVEARGVECLRRSKRSEATARDLAARLTDCEAVETRFGSHATLLRRKLAEFYEQMDRLAARQAEGETLGVPNAPHADAELTELLERWEAQVRDTELVNGSLPFSLDGELEEPRDAAEEAALVLELRELKENKR